MEVESNSSAKAAAPGPATTPTGFATSPSTGSVGGTSAAASGPPLFEAFYDDWEAFDAAVARAVAQHHPIRKRSSLTFDVYNRTVSKGKHDRRQLADFLSKTFKCTHGIKFRPRSSGKRSRHKLRDIGCPFHVYASAVEFGPTYRVKVRVNAEHNHPIGPDAVKTVSVVRDLSPQDVGASSSAGLPVDAPSLSHAAASAAASSSGNVLHTPTASAFAQEVTTDAQLVQTQALRQAIEQAHVHALLKAQEQAHVREMEGHEHPLEQAGDLLDGSGHDSETLLASAIENSIDEGVFISSGPSTATPATVSAEVRQSQHKFGPTLTLEALRRRAAAFADERNLDQYHTPRNLVLALTGEVGELCELFQWKGECKDTDDWSEEDKQSLGEELSDVMLYLVRLADKCNVDLPAALDAKMRKNSAKNPAELTQRSAKKHSQNKRMRVDKESV